MKKKNLIVIALASTALAIGGGVALASSMAPKAIEVEAARASTVFVTLGEGSAWKSWNPSADKVKVHFWGNPETETKFPGKEVSAVTIDGVNYFKTIVPSGSTSMIVTVWGGGVDKNKTENLAIPTDGKNVFTVTSNTESGTQSGAWSTLESEQVFKLVGTGTAALGGWSTTSSTLTMTAAGVSGYLKKIENVPLAVNDEFKVVNIDAENWYGGSFLATDATRAKFNILDGGNFQVKAAGSYDVYLKDSANGHRVAILTHGESIGDVKNQPFTNDTLYLTRPKSVWGSTLYAYAFNSSGHNQDWPGVPMTKVVSNQYGEEIYSISGMTGYENIIFSDGSVQTVDGSAEAFGPNDACWIGDDKDNDKYTFGGYYNFDDDQGALIDWAKTFIGAEDLCDGSGDEWSKYAASYTALDPEAKAFFTTAKVTANQSGNVLEKAAYRYERGVAAKNQTAFAESQRPKTGFQANYAAVMNLSRDNKNNITAIAVTAAVGAAAAVGFFFIRKRKAI